MFTETHRGWSRTDHGAVCRYTPTICDGPVFRWQWCRGFEVSASRNGVVLSGDSPQMGESETDRLGNLIDVAASVHRQLDRSRHRDPDGLWFGDSFIAWSSFSK